MRNWLQALRTEAGRRSRRCAQYIAVHAISLLLPVLTGVLTWVISQGERLQSWLRDVGQRYVHDLLKG